MNNHLDSETADAYVYDRTQHLTGPFSTSSRTEPYSQTIKIVSTLALLVLGYYALTIFDAWPATIQRSTYDLLICLIPSRAIYALQSIMVQLHYLPEDSPRLRREDFGNPQVKVEELRRIFGHTKIQTAVRKARTLSGLDQFVQDTEHLVPAGLGNWDNSCYQNSVLQALASLPLFRTYIERNSDKCDNAGVSAETHHALADFVERLNEMGSRKTTLWTPRVLKSMDSWQQQDAQEYFSVVLDAIDKEAIKANNAISLRRGPGLESILTDDRKLLRSLVKSDHALETTRTWTTSISQDAVARNSVRSSMMHNPLDGFLAQALECQTCGYSEGISLTQFNCLTMNLGLRNHSRVEDLLDDYTEAEDIEGVECINCTKIASIRTDENGSATESTDTRGDPEKPVQRVLRTKAKQMTLGRLPKDLVLHINRSIFDDFGNQRKNSAFISFPTVLRFGSQWCAAWDFESDDPTPQAVYELKCVISHYGRHENGHYVALGKRGKRWYTFNDEIVTEVGEEEVLSRGNVFMLFYEMRPVSAGHGAQPATTVEQGSIKQLGALRISDPDATDSVLNDLQSKTETGDRATSVLIDDSQTVPSEILATPSLVTAS